MQKVEFRNESFRWKVTIKNAQAYIPVHAQVGLTNAMQIFYASALVIQLNLFFGLKQVVALYYGETRINNAKMKKS